MVILVTTACTSLETLTAGLATKEYMNSFNFPVLDDMYVLHVYGIQITIQHTLKTKDKGVS